MGIFSKRKEPSWSDRIPGPVTDGYHFVRELIDQIGEDHVMSFAASLAYRALFALFPFLILVISILGAIDQLGLLTDALDSVKDGLPSETYNLLSGEIDRLATSAAGTFTVSAVVSALFALWGISGGYRAVMESLNVTFDTNDSRGTVKRYLLSIELALSTVGLLLIAMLLVVVGPNVASWLADATNTGSAATVTWGIVQWPLVIVLVAVAFGIVYRVAPDVERPRRYFTRGILICVAGWLVFTLGFSFYVNNFSSYNKTYGTLAGVAILMLYLYYSSFIMLLGAQIDLLIERRAPRND